MNLLLREVQAQIQNVDSVENGFKSQTDLIDIQYSVTINYLPTNNPNNFQCNVVKVIRKCESICSNFARIFYLMQCTSNLHEKLIILREKKIYLRLMWNKDYMWSIWTENLICPTTISRDVLCKISSKYITYFSRFRKSLFLQFMFICTLHAENS
jgi:hypothetical protein